MVLTTTLAAVAVDTNQSGPPDFERVGSAKLLDRWKTEDIPDALQGCGGQAAVVQEAVILDSQAEILLLRQRLSERDLLVEDLVRQLNELRSKLAENEYASRPAERPRESSGQEKEQAIAIDELRNNIGAQRQELDELKRLKSITDDQGLQTHDLRAKTAELTATNVDLEARIVELEQMRAAPELLEIEAPLVENVQSRQSPLRPRIARDLVDMRLQEYLSSRPDFAIDIDKVKPGWYVFGEPVCKKLYLKVVGEHLVCRVGGGHKDLFKYLDDHRFALHDRMAHETEIVRARSKRRASRDQGTGDIVRLSSS